MIGSSDGKQYESQFDVELGKPIELSQDLQPVSKKDQSRVPQGETAPRTIPKAPTPEHLPFIDRSHDVPLAASALHKDGQMYGIAIDKDAPIIPQYDPYIYKHEADEFDYMKDLITNGMKPTEAYKKAHDHITPMESARVQADLGEKGLEDYKQYWRDVTSISTAKDNPNRHPDAHTTTYGLDESELGKQYAMNDNFDPFNPMTPKYSNPGGHTVKSDVGILNPTRATQMRRPANENKNLQLETPEPNVEAGPFVKGFKELEAMPEEKRREFMDMAVEHWKQTGNLAHTPEELKELQSKGQVLQFPVDETTKKFNIEHPSEETLKAQEKRYKYPSIYKGLDELKQQLSSKEWERAKFLHQEKLLDEDFKQKMGMSDEDLKYWKAWIKQNPDYFK